MDIEIFFNSLILKALKQKSTDLHLTFRDGQGLCEFRTLKGLVKLRNLKLDKKLMDYIKYQAKLDLLQSYKPQTGFCKIEVGHQMIQLRIAHIKNNLIESIVIRIMNPPNYLDLETLFHSEDLIKIREIMNQTSGLILISGSTGSGKTTTLYTMINDYRESKIYTIEDPIESYYDNLVQLQVNERQDLSFNSALKQVLRHDPNIIVIGEIRDEIEAKAALRCALTGHLVFSTIHANSAIKTIDRLNNLGLDQSEIKSVLNLVIHQHLEVEGNKRKMSYELYQP